jgi:hypothetical protein
MVAYCSSCREDRGRHTLRGIHSSSHDSRRRYLKKEHKSIIPGGAMVIGGVCLMYLQNYIRVISLIQKGRDYSEEVQRNSYRGSSAKESSSNESSPKMRMALCHLCQRGRVNHIDVIDVYRWGEIVTLTIDVEHSVSTC